MTATLVHILILSGACVWDEEPEEEELLAQVGSGCPLWLARVVDGHPVVWRGVVFHAL